MKKILASVFIFSGAALLFLSGLCSTDPITYPNYYATETIQWQPLETNTSMDYLLSSSLESIPELTKVNPALPDDGFIACSDSIGFQWNSVYSAEQYRIIVSTYEAMTPVYGEYIIYDPYLIYFQAHNIENGLYYWRIRAEYTSIDPPVEGEWSNRYSFEVKTIPAVNLLLPTHEETIKSSQPLFIWSDQQNATQFLLQWSVENSFPGAVTEEKEVLNTYYKTEDTLLSGTSYFWRVRGISDRCLGDWSNVQTFFIE